MLQSFRLISPFHNSVLLIDCSLKICPFLLATMKFTLAIASLVPLAIFVAAAPVRTLNPLWKRQSYH